MPILLGLIATLIATCGAKLKHSDTGSASTVKPQNPVGQVRVCQVQ